MRPTVLLAVFTILLVTSSAAEPVEGPLNAAGILSMASVSAEAPANPEILAPQPVPVGKGAIGDTPEFTHQTWGRAVVAGYTADGIVYGPTFAKAGMSVVDIDGDQDNDFVFRPDLNSPPQLIRNLGTSGSYVPGGRKDLDLPDPEGGTLTPFMDFKDLTGDDRPDVVGAVSSSSLNEVALVWYRNTGSATAPAFTVGGEVYRTSVTTTPNVYPAITDYNDDGLQDIVFVEYFYQGGSNHGVFVMYNSGTGSSPSWDAPVEIPDLSRLLPAPVSLKNMKSRDRKKWAQIKRDPLFKGTTSGFLTGISDIEFVDWWNDNPEEATRDFMFYDILEGVQLVENLGTNAAPDWESFVDPLVGFKTSGSFFYFGTFAVRRNPNLVNAEWLDDWYIADYGHFYNLRYYYADEGVAGGYELLSVGTYDLNTGQGPASFWDWDGDGDKDLFRSDEDGFGGTILWVLENVGTPYAPVWGGFTAFDGFSLDYLPTDNGNPSNWFRQALHTFADLDGDGQEDFLVQQEDGQIGWYSAYNGGGRPVIEPMNATYPSFDFSGINFNGYTNIQARGIAVANFNNNLAGSQQILTVFNSDRGAKFISYPYVQGEFSIPPGDNFYANIADLSDGILLDEFGDPLGIYLIESIATADLNLDGLPDLVVTLSPQENFADTEQHLYINTRFGDNNQFFTFVYTGLLSEPAEVDSDSGRMVSFTDIDSDGDDDMFISHQETPFNVSSSSDLSHYMRFYRNDEQTGLDYWRTRVVSGQSWSLRWNGVLPDYDFVFNGSGGFISGPGTYEAGNASQVVDIIESQDLDRNIRVFIDVLPEVSASESKAILVLGSDPADPLFDTFAELTEFAYYTLRVTGLPPEAIRLYATGQVDIDDNGSNDVNGPPTLAAMEDSITNWAQGTDRLLVYLIDHGQRDRFRVSESEYLEAPVYASWLNQIPGTLVTTVIDTCEAGTFIDDLALSKDALKRGVERLTITSSNGGPIEGIALFDQRTLISFSLSFWREIFNGRTYGEAFELATIQIEAVNPLQKPQIDADADGIANESNDTVQAKNIRPGADFEVAGSSVFIGDIAPNQAANSNSVELWLGDVVTDFPIDEAGALVVPPNFQRQSVDSDDEQPITGLDYVPFDFDEATGRWGATYSDLTEGGLYRVQYFVSALGQYYVSPRIGFVDRIGIPDAWESDDTFDTAQWLPVNSVQGHNFHQANDEDWVRFSAPAGLAATLALIAPGLNNRPVMELYRKSDLDANPNAAPIREGTARTRGWQIVVEHTFAANEEFFLRIRNLDGSQFGEGTSYLVMVAVGTGAIIPTSLVVDVRDFDSGAPLSGAEVKFNDGPGTLTTEEGLAFFIVPEYGSYTLDISRSGYEDSNGMISVNNTAESVKLKLVKKDVGEGEGEGEGESESEGEGPPPQCGSGIGSAEGQSGAFGDFLTLFASGGLLFWATRRVGNSYSITGNSL
jgi:hypothetical protein